MRFVVSVFVLVVACAPAADRPAGAPRGAGVPPARASAAVTNDLAIDTAQLANGLRVVFVTDPRAPEIAVTARYQVGSVDDPPDQPGLAHLVEHLMYEPVVDGQTIFARLEAATSYFNGATTPDGTTFVARARPDRLGALLALEVARLTTRCATVAPAGFAREREVVINELRQKDQATQILGAIHRAVYPAGHPYARPVGGTPDTVASVTREQACAFVDAHYAPGNAAIAVAGALTAAQRGQVLDALGAVPARPGVAPRPIYAVPFAPMAVAAQLPVDDDALLVAWPLPVEPRWRAKVRAVVAAQVGAIDRAIAGSVTALELGDARAPVIGIAVFPAEGETLAATKGAVERALAKLPPSLDPRRDGGLAFDRLQHAATYRIYRDVEDDDRDTRLAALALAGGDPRTVVGAELAAIDQLTALEAAELATDTLAIARAKVVVLQAKSARRGAARTGLAAPPHDLGQPQRAVDAAAAHAPGAATELAPTAAPIWRALPNGLQYVLVPTSSVPTVELRLVLRAGTGDEPAGQRGIASVAAHALAWDKRDLEDLAYLEDAGGARGVDVAMDATAFTTHGATVDLVALLAGLRTWVAAGTYRDALPAVLADLGKARGKPDAGAAFVDAWRGAVYGAAHPYAGAGLLRRASATLGLADVEAFRAAHYTPDNAVLVVTGRFDPAFAQQWIAYLFGAWRGTAARRPAAVPALQVASIARVEPASTQVRVQLALPARAGSRAARLVAAELLAAIASDVRFELGASYDLDSQLFEQRMSTVYAVSGSIDAARAADAMRLVVDHLAHLRAGTFADADPIAREFVLARTRVAQRLGAVGNAARELAERVVADVALARPPLSDRTTAAEVQALTLEQVAPLFADLDLARAAIAMTGPAADVQAAFAALGRTPTLVP